MTRIFAATANYTGATVIAYLAVCITFTQILAPALGPAITPWVTVFTLVVIIGAAACSVLHRFSRLTGGAGIYLIAGAVSLGLLVLFASQAAEFLPALSQFKQEWQSLDSIARYCVYGWFVLAPWAFATASSAALD